MERLKYVGAVGPKRVKVPGCGEVSRGEKLSVPDEMAAALVKQNPENWEREKTPKAEKPEVKPRSDVKEG